MGIVAAGAGRLSALAVTLHVGNAIASNDQGQNKDNGNHYGQFKHDGNGGNGTTCFCAGTLIQTPHGEVAVDALGVGHKVMTTNGALPVKWVGRKTHRKNAHAAWHPSVLPVKVSRFAIDDQTPQRDLYLSQLHCLFIDGVLIPVKHLVNGRSITLIDPTVETIEYFCVELDTHQVIFAEGTAVETFWYSGGQIPWDNLEEYQAIYGSEHELIPPFAPIWRHNGGRAEARALLRLAASRFVDVRDPIQIAYDWIAARAMAIAA